MVWALVQDNHYLSYKSFSKIMTAKTYHYKTFVYCMNLNYYLSLDVCASFRLCLSVVVFLQKNTFGEQTSRILEPSPQGLISSTLLQK